MRCCVCDLSPYSPSSAEHARSHRRYPHHLYLRSVLPHPSPLPFDFLRRLHRLDWDMAYRTAVTASWDSSVGRRSWLLAVLAGSLHLRRRRRVCSLPNGIWRSWLHKSKEQEKQGRGGSRYKGGRREAGLPETYTMFFSISTSGLFPKEDTAVSYKLKNPNPLDAKLLCPLGKLLHPSCSLW